MYIIKLDIQADHPFQPGVYDLSHFDDIKGPVLISKNIESNLADVKVDHMCNITHTGHVLLNRDPKDVQIEVINRLFGKDPLSRAGDYRFQRIEVIDTQTVHKPYLNVKQFIIKPIAGARSIGMLVVQNPNALEPNPKVYLPEFFSALREAIKHASSAKVSDGEDPHDVWYQALRGAFKFKECLLHFHRGAERDAGESLTYYRSDNYLVTTMLTDIKAEFRLVCIGGKVEFINRRELYAAGDGGFAFPDDPDHLITNVAKHQTLVSNVSGMLDFEPLRPIIEEINSKLSKFIPDYGSIDLALTDHTWSILEYSEQFSWGEIEPDNLVELRDKFLHHLLTKRAL